jgi:hypothetical protein
MICSTKPNVQPSPVLSTRNPSPVSTKFSLEDPKPTTKRIEELADIYAFLFKTLNMPYHKP